MAFPNVRYGIASLLGVLVLWNAAPAHAQGMQERNLDRNLADARLMRNIEPLKGASAQVLRLLPVRFQVQSPVSGALVGPLRMGFVAQQLQPVFPGLVLRDYDSKGTLRVEYGQLIPVLTRAFQEQYSHLKTLEAQLGAMNQELVALRAENGRLTVGLAAVSVAARPDPVAAGQASQIAELQRAVRQLQTPVSQSPFR